MAGVAGIEPAVFPLTADCFATQLYPISTQFLECKPPKSDLNGRPPVLQTGALTQLSYWGRYVRSSLECEQRERQDLNLQPSAPQADALSNCATLSNLKIKMAENSGLEPQALFRLHLFSKQRSPPDEIAFHVELSFDSLKGRVGVVRASVPEGYTQCYKLRFYRPLSAPIEADPLAVATGIEPASTQLKAVRLYQFAYATSKVLH